MRSCHAHAWLCTRACACGHLPRAGALDPGRPVPHSAPSPESSPESAPRVGPGEQPSEDLPKLNPPAPCTFKILPRPQRLRYHISPRALASALPSSHPPSRNGACAAALSRTDATQKPGNRGRPRGYGVCPRNNHARAVLDCLSCGHRQRATVQWMVPAGSEVATKTSSSKASPKAFSCWKGII